MSDLFDDLRNEGSGAMRFDEEEEAPVAFTDFSNFDNYDDLDDDPRPQEDRPRASRRKGKGFLGMTAGYRKNIDLTLRRHSWFSRIWCGQFNYLKNQ
jgi:hypothetical protein